MYIFSGNPKLQRNWPHRCERPRKSKHWPGTAATVEPVRLQEGEFEHTKEVTWPKKGEQLTQKCGYIPQSRNQCATLTPSVHNPFWVLLYLLPNKNVSPITVCTFKSWWGKEWMSQKATTYLSDGQRRLTAEHWEEQRNNYTITITQATATPMTDGIGIWYKQQTLVITVMCHFGSTHALFPGLCWSVFAIGFNLKYLQTLRNHCTNRHSRNHLIIKKIYTHTHFNFHKDSSPTNLYSSDVNF